MRQDFGAIVVFVVVVLNLVRTIAGLSEKVQIQVQVSRSWIWDVLWRVTLHIVKDVVKHHFVHLFRHPSVHPSGHPSVPSWSVYSDRAEKEWNTDGARLRIIYISVVKKKLIFNFGIFGLRYTHPVSFSPTKRVGLGFFLFFWKFYLEYWKFSMLFTLP